MIRRLIRRSSRAEPARAGAVAEQDIPFRREILGFEHQLEGRCNVCGLPARFSYGEEQVAREQLVCEHCGTTSRYRSIARGVLQAVRDVAGVDAESITELSQLDVGRALRVYDTQVPFRYAPCAYPIPALLASCSWIDVQTSLFDPSLPWGHDLGTDCTNQNLERLTFPDDRFDIVVTSDVLEHVRLARTALAEVARVLRPGGLFVFTVPHTRGQRETIERVAVPDPDDPSKDEFILEPEYHGDANSRDGQGALAYRVYGTDLDDWLAELGFEVSYTRDDVPDAGILNTELFYCRLVRSPDRPAVDRS